MEIEYCSGFYHYRLEGIGSNIYVWPSKNSKCVYIEYHVGNLIYAFSFNPEKPEKSSSVKLTNLTTGKEDVYVLNLKESYQLEKDY